MTVAPGQNNSVTDVKGIMVGNAVDMSAGTGVTVIIPPTGNGCSVEVRGGSPCTRETDLLMSEGAATEINALVLSGGSVFGLEAASGVVDNLASAGTGLRIRGWNIPIVPSAHYFDLFGRGARNAKRVVDYRALGSEAIEAATHQVRLGNEGAGLGAKAGSFKSGLGSASYVLGNGVTVAAITVANPMGSVLMPDNKTFWAWPFEYESEFGGHRPLRNFRTGPTPLPSKPTDLSNTVIGAVVTDAALSPSQLKSFCSMAHDGISRSIVPSHTPEDGDTLFALTTNQRTLEWPPGVLAELGSAAADCVARSICRAVYRADGVPGLQGYREVIER